mmetsp:Transcript_9513/g.25822  ORF Transcript_9513/g.25822 Transcript_9513/m.25822 type:complete len:588 (-) Transcript_9513:43-1806(-)
MVRADGAMDEAGGASFGVAGATTQPEILTGGFFQETAAVHQAEGLQDFKRKQEGHLIIADDRPLLVMAFGLKYQGANPAKYKIEGKYDIPVGYKVIIKWDEDEIVFMTREGTFGPEFQIIYLPKSPVPEDFTMFQWNANIADIWDQFLTVIEGKDDRDMRLFNQGPWRTFGVTRDEVQIALKQGTDVKTAVDRILYCADNKTPTKEEYARYLGIDPVADEAYGWIVKCMMEEPKPAHIFEYIQDGMVYWFNAQTQETFWKHPLYDKYKRMLQVARAQRPVPVWKPIMQFRIEFLLNSVFRNTLDEDQERPPLVETVENVVEMARIFKVDIQDEPYMVHVLRRALRHYGHAVREKRKVKDTEDFRNLMLRYRDLVAQFEQAKDTEIRKVQQMKVCIQCDERDAVLFCDNCRDFFCQACFDRLHSRGRRKTHRRTWVEMGMCAECSEAIALFHCVQCADLYCRDCFQEWHVRGGRRNHIPIILRSFNSQTDKLADATPAMGTGAAKVLAQARSPWFCFTDENNIKFYYNFETGESKRDMPLAVINEPIEENKGGGLASGWAGTWGSNMFPDPLDQREAAEGQFAMETAF